MKEQLINYDTAILAKAKGFDVPVRYGVYGKQMKLTTHYFKHHQEDINWNVSTKQQMHSNATSVPTQSLLQRWLREVHLYHIYPKQDYQNNWFYKIIGVDHEIFSLTSYLAYKTYEEALEKALQEALNLIIK